MKIRFICCLATFLILCGYNSYASHTGEAEKLVSKLKSTQDIYTAYNLYAFRDKVHSINYKNGTLIPVGTKIKKMYIKSWWLTQEIYFDSQQNSLSFASADTMTSKNDERITFTTDDNKEYRYIFKYRHHRGKAFLGYANDLLSDKNFSQQTEGFGDDVISAIRKGIVIDGMTREQVVMSMGYPPEHRTRSLDSPDWIYWMNKKETKKICFNSEGLTFVCGSYVGNKSLALSTANKQLPDINSRLDTLRKLFESGLISEEDYSQKKNSILKDL